MGRHIRSDMLKLDKKARQELRRQIRKTKNRKFADRLRVVLLKSEGYRHHQIAKLLQMGINQVTETLKRYLKGGLEALLKDNYQGSQPKLTVEQQNALKIELKTKIYNNADQVIAWVEKQWNVTYRPMSLS